MARLPKLLLLLSLIASTSAFSSNSRVPASNENPFALMTPSEGQEAFDLMYGQIAKAKKEVFVTVYSWSDAGFTKAMESLLTANPQVKLRVALNKGLIDSAKTKKAVEDLEKMGAMFKQANMELHEKFVLVDGVKLINSSANMSGGAKAKYSENFVFLDGSQDKREEIKSILNDFNYEAAVIWNAADDIVTASEKNKADILPMNQKRENVPTVGSDITLYSSSMNYTIKPNATTSANYLKGRAISLTSKKYPGSTEQTWTVKDKIVELIKSAKRNIYLNMNHFNIEEIAMELVAASARGVDVRLMMDNQEYKTYPNGKEYTINFITEWKKLSGNSKKGAPVRFKFYSFQPDASVWLLNHHKYMVIDYKTNDTVLITGSYNYSETAEHGKFDNQVVYQGPQFENLYDKYVDEFESMWSLNRDSSDRPIPQIRDIVLTPNAHGSYPLHSNTAIALTFDEIKTLKSELVKKVPEAATFYKFKSCLYFSPSDKTFFPAGCDTK